MYIRKCVNCNQVFEARRSIDKRCHECAVARRRTGSPDVRSCTDCGILFSTSRRTAVRCPECAVARHRTGSPHIHSPEGRRPRQRRKTFRDISERTFWGIDGEGGDQDGRHNYLFMAAHSSDEQIRRLENKDGSPLRTIDCLWFLWKLPRGVYFWYASSYDWTKILSDIDRETLALIYKNPNPFEPVWWRGFGICYLPANNAVTIYREFPDPKNPGKIRRVGKFFGDLWKCLGLGSFVNAITTWGIGTPRERRIIAEIKTQRSAFSKITEKIRYYCLLEVRLLAQLAKTALTAFAEIGITPRRWYSAGSAAKHVMRQHWDIAGRRGPDRYAGAHAELRHHIMRAVGGGRFEVSETGLHDILYSYDISSAHPGNMRDLPCLAHGRWVHHDSSWTPDTPCALGHVTWKGDLSLRWGPFPFRTTKRGPAYPCLGEGWYWAKLVTAGRKMPGCDVRVIEWWAWEQSCDHQPFRRITELYDKRKEWGKNGKGMALKVTINAMFGSLADTVSESSDIASAVWAGMITNGTQSQLCEVLAAHGDEVVSVATDGIMAKSPILGDATPKTLGEWDYEGVSRGVFIIQPGLMFCDHAPKGDGAKTRGHAYQDLLEVEEALQAAWQADGWDAKVEYERERFIPARAALARKEYLEHLGQWETTPVKISFKPSYRLTGPVRDRIGYSTAGMYIHFCPEAQDLSAPYQKLLDLENADFLFTQVIYDGQP